MSERLSPGTEASLLPCPFCGPGQSMVSVWFDDVSHRYRVGCGRCGCSTGISPRDKTPALAWIEGQSTDQKARELATTALSSAERG